MTLLSVFVGAALGAMLRYVMITIGECNHHILQQF